MKILKKRERESEEERKSAVIALGRIGDPSAVGPLMEQFDVGYSTVVVYWIKGGIEEALRAITGEEEIWSCSNGKSGSPSSGLGARA